jgi:hypothetical protein
LAHPRFTDFKEAQEKATDSKDFNLTAVGEYRGASVEGDLLDLSATLTFCQQQWVQITVPLRGDGIEQVMNALPPRLDLPYRRPTQGALIISDAFAPDARRSFVELCMSKLSDKHFGQGTNFRSAFSRSVESWRLQQSFVDLTYYLDFSALEILARTAENDFTTKNVAEVIAKFLQRHGFGVTQDNLNERHLGVQTYAHLRNALFHNGEFETTINENGHSVTLLLTKYQDYLRRLVPDVLLKVMGYDDRHIHWSRWIDRMSFQ